MDLAGRRRRRSPASPFSDQVDAGPAAGRRRDAERARDDGDVAGRPRPPPAPGRAAWSRSYSSSSAGPMLRAIRMAFSRQVAAAAVRLARSGGAAAGWRDRRNRAAGRADRGRSCRAMPGAGVALHPLDRRLGGQAVLDRFLQAPHPAAVVGEHPVGFEHLASARRLRRRRRATSMSSTESAQAAPSPHRGAASPRVDILGDQLVTTTRGSCSTTWPRPRLRRTPTPLKRDRPVQRRARRPGSRQLLQLADGDHLGQHHGRGLQRLHLLLGSRCGGCGSARPARRACGRRAAPARRGRTW